MSNKSKRQINIVIEVKESDDGGWVTEVKPLGLFDQGESVAEAVRNATDGLLLNLENAADNGVFKLFEK